MSALIPIITTKGLAAVFNAENTGYAAKITHIALGDNGRTPSKGELGLTNERMRIPIADGERVDDHQIHVTALADGNTEFWVREIGFMLEDGTMLAVWSDKDSPLAYKSTSVSLMLAFDLVLEALPAESVTVIGTGANLSLAAWGEQFAAIASASVGNMARHVKLMFEQQALVPEIDEIAAKMQLVDKMYENSLSAIGEMDKKIKDVNAALEELEKQGGLDVLTTVPVGGWIAYAGAALPSDNWMWCFGDNYDPAIYPTLKERLNDKYGENKLPNPSQLGIWASENIDDVGIKDADTHAINATIENLKIINGADTYKKVVTSISGSVGLPARFSTNFIIRVK